MKKRLVCLALAIALLLPLMPSAMAISSLDVYAISSFDKSYPVYSGPGKHYYRANDGKASYGGGAVRVYGITGDWVMIGYQLSNGNYRIGYVDKDALNHAKYIDGVINGRLEFANIKAKVVTDRCYMTDDPVISVKFFYTVPKGTEVTVLSTMGLQTYVEVVIGNTYIRGFVDDGNLRFNAGEGLPVTDPTIYEPYEPSVTAAPTAVPPTKVPPTYPPVTYPPVTYPPVTYPPVTYPPVTYPPVTYPPVTYAPVTYPPVTYAPVTYAPVTYPPVTAEPTTPVDVPNSYYHDTTKGTWLPSYQRVTLSGSWPVYSGPGEYYYRAANGKALMGGGSCILFGIENNWALIGYGLSNGGFRVGYVTLAALPQQGLRIPYLDLTYSTRQLVMQANLTDDIMRTKPTVTTLPMGTYVLFLGYVYESYTTWAYVEVLSNNTIMRGFIPSYALGQ